MVEVDVLIESEAGSRRERLRVRRVGARLFIEGGVSNEAEQ